MFHPTYSAVAAYMVSNGNTERERNELARTFRARGILIRDAQNLTIDPLFVQLLEEA